MSSTRTDVPWLSPAHKRQCKRKQRLYNRARKSGKPEHKPASSTAQKSVQRALKQARWGYIIGIVQACLDEGSKQFRGYIRQQQQYNIGVSRLKEGGKLHANSQSRVRFLSLARSKLRLCSANHRPGYWSNLPCDWPSTAWAYSEQETENGPRCEILESQFKSVFTKDVDDLLRDIVLFGLSYPPLILLLLEKRQLGIWAPSQYKDRLIYVWRFPC